MYRGGGKDISCWLVVFVLTLAVFGGLFEGEQ